MTEGQQAHFENEILGAALSAEKDVIACRLRLAVMGQHLESLGCALQEHPEEVNPLPEPQSMYDYREGLRLIRTEGQKVVDMCKELRVLIQRAKTAGKRKEMLSSGAFASRDLGV
jgi:hypothetical protein